MWFKVMPVQNLLVVFAWVPVRSGRDRDLPGDRPDKARKFSSDGHLKANYVTAATRRSIIRAHAGVYRLHWKVNTIPPESAYLLRLP